jgi:hypothetical protein
MDESTTALSPTYQRVFESEQPLTNRPHYGSIRTYLFISDFTIAE